MTGYHAGVTRTWVVWLACAWLAVAAPAAAQGVAVTDASEEQVAAARAPYVEAKKAYDAGEFATALPQFRASYDVVASPNSHLMVVKSLVGLGRLVDAYREAKVALAEAEAAAATIKKYTRTAVDAQAQLEELRAQLGFVTIQLQGALGPEGTVTVAGEAVAPDRLDDPIPVMPGTVIVIVTSDKGQVERSLQVGAGGRALVELSTTPPPVGAGVAEDDGEGFQLGTPQTIGLVVGGVGIAGMVTFAIFGSMASSAFADLEDECPDGHCAPELADDIDSGETKQIVANVGLVIGIAGLIGGAALFMLEPDAFDSGDDDGEGGESAVFPALRLGVGPGSLQLSGSF